MTLDSAYIALVAFWSHIPPPDVFNHHDTATRPELRTSPESIHQLSGDDSGLRTIIWGRKCRIRQIQARLNNLNQGKLPYRNMMELITHYRGDTLQTIPLLLEVLLNVRLGSRRVPSRRPFQRLHRCLPYVHFIP